MLFFAFDNLTQMLCIPTSIFNNYTDYEQKLEIDTDIKIHALCTVI